MKDLMDEEMDGVLFKAGDVMAMRNAAARTWAVVKPWVETKCWEERLAIVILATSFD